jgi:apolipoprotein N-acyltransferase
VFIKSVPFIEDDVKAGPPVLPTYYDSEYDLTFGGGICFDLDFSQYIRQAGVKKVNIMLQPSWTWNAISSRHFNGDAVRAIENGFNLLRCSSEGESGTIGTAGRVNTRQFTGSGTKNADSTTNDVPISIFFLPLAARVDTMFTAVGFIFEYLLMIAAIVIYISIIIPLKYISVLVNISEMSKSV